MPRVPEKCPFTLLLVWNCQLPRDLCGTHLSVVQLSSILHTFASPLSSWSDSWFAIICMSAMIMLFGSGVCVECGLLLHGKSWILACPPVVQLTALSVCSHVWIFPTVSSSCTKNSIAACCLWQMAVVAAFFNRCFRNTTCGSDWIKCE